jgi:ornithine cyclodeaminase
MTAPAPRWISEADVVQLMHLGEAIDALGRGLIEEAAGSARNMEKTAAHWGASSNMHAIGAVFEGAGGWNQDLATPRQGPRPALSRTQPRRSSWRSSRHALGQMRTADVGIATRWMSDAGATISPSSAAASRP